MTNPLPRIERKTLLYRSAVGYADYALNHIEGCSHGCTYPCYAMLMKKRYGAVNTYDGWLQPKLVGNALELLDKELPRLKNKIERVFLCFATDPFMYGVGEVEELTLRVLSRLREDDIRAILISKGLYPPVLSASAAYNPENEYGSTIVSLSEEFRMRFEPYAAPVSERIAALKGLHDGGLKTWVSMEPYPTPNLVKQDIREVLQAVNFVDRIVFGKWNYSRQTSGFDHYREFYNSMACEVIKFGLANSIDVHIKEGSIDPSCLTDNQALALKRPMFPG